MQIIIDDFDPEIRRLASDALSKWLHDQDDTVPNWKVAQAATIAHKLAKDAVTERRRQALLN